MQKYYKAEMDRQLRVTTRLVWGVMALAAGGLLFAWFKTLPACRPAPAEFRSAGPWILPFFAAVIAASIWLTRAMAPRGYELNDVELRVDRRVKAFSIPLSDVLEYGPFDGAVFRRSLRLLGAAGFYGYYGRFWNRTAGFFRAYATRFDGLVFVRTAKARFVLSPDDPADFLKTLTALLKR